MWKKPFSSKRGKHWQDDIEKYREMNRAESERFWGLVNEYREMFQYIRQLSQEDSQEQAEQTKEPYVGAPTTPMQIISAEALREIVGIDESEEAELEWLAQRPNEDE